MSGLIHITADGARPFCAGAIFTNGKVSYRRREVAPIIHYMRGWSPVRVQDYCLKRGWRFSISYDR